MRYISGYLSVTFGFCFLVCWICGAYFLGRRLTDNERLWGVLIVPGFLLTIAKAFIFSLGNGQSNPCN